METSIYRKDERCEFAARQDPRAVHALRALRARRDCKLTSIGAWRLAQRGINYIFSVLYLSCNFCLLAVIQTPSTRTTIFLNPQLFLSGYGFRPHVTILLADVRWGVRCIRHLNSQLFESAFQSKNFLIRYESEIVCTLNLDFFLSGNVKGSSPVLYREYCIHSI